MEGAPALGRAMNHASFSAKFPPRKPKRLLLDSGVLADQELNEFTQQRFASLADVVDKLEEPEVEREFLLRNAPMRTKPTPQQRPKALHRIHMHFTKPVAIFISGILTSPMVDTLMAVSPGTQAGINTVLICLRIGVKITPGFKLAPVGWSNSGFVLTLPLRNWSTISSRFMCIREQRGSSTWADNRQRRFSCCV